MIELFNYFLAGLGWLMLLLILYIVLFRVYYHTQKEDRTWKFWLWFAPLALLFLILDVLLNATVMWILMLDPPSTWTITERMQDYKARPENRRKGLHKYRFWFADSMCMILNVFDENHC